jgi:hypothetical protein
MLDKMFQGGAQSHVNELLYTSKDIFKASSKLCVLFKYDYTFQNRLYSYQDCKAFKFL